MPSTHPACAGYAPGIKVRPKHSQEVLSQIRYKTAPRWGPQYGSGHVAISLLIALMQQGL